MSDNNTSLSDPTFIELPRVKILTVGDIKTGKSCFIKRYCEGRFISKYIPTIGIDYGVKKIDLNSSSLLSASNRLKKKNNNNDNNKININKSYSVRVNFWDCSGANEYEEIRNEFYTAAQGIILIYDVRNADSFAAIENHWIKEINLYINNNNNNNNGISDVEKIKKRSSTTASTPAGIAVGNIGEKKPVVIICANKVDDLIDDLENNSSNNKLLSKRVISEAQGKKIALDNGFEYFETSASSGLNIEESFDYLLSEVYAKFFM